MKTGKKPIAVPVAFVVRDFRGARLYLASIHTGNGMRWHSDKAQAMALEPGDALSIAERASKHWGTECAVIDAQGNMSRKAAEPIALSPIAITESGKAKIAAHLASRKGAS